MPGYVGIEYVIVKVAQYFKNATHVHKTKHKEFYNLIADLDTYITPILTDHRIHACSKAIRM